MLKLKFSFQNCISVHMEYSYILDLRGKAAWLIDTVENYVLMHRNIISDKNIHQQFWW